MVQVAPGPLSVCLSICLSVCLSVSSFFLRSKAYMVLQIVSRAELFTTEFAFKLTTLMFRFDVTPQIS